ncbi:MAG: IS21 family transposase [Burkholderiaceae bacterium]|nr:IS21 family transposase [Burkholderiaceae bacterium]
MLRMDQYEHIRTAHRVYGQSISDIARTTGHSRNTIRKALSGQYSGYAPRQQQPYPVLGPYMDIVDGWLRSDQDQPPKQRHTAERIFQRLVAEHGYAGSASNIRKYVREAKERLGIALSKAFLPLEPDLGKEAEVDWGTATVVLQGQPVRAKFFCMRSKASGKPFVRLYPCERQQAFFDALMCAFAFYGGIFPRLIFDNLTSAVRKVLQGKARLEQESFSRFRAYYNFEARFCNPGAGHEKGGVEGLVGYARRNFLVPVPRAESFEGVNEHLLHQCQAYGRHTISGKDKPVNVLFAEERSHLLALPPVPFANEKLLSAKADKFSTVVIDKNRYSVPTRLVGHTLRVLCHVDTLEVFERGKRVACHRREFANNKWQLDPDHYLELLKQRPLAFHSARPIRDWKKRWPKEMHQLLERFCQAHGENGGVKAFIDVLMLFRHHPAQHVEAAIVQALAAGVSASDGVRHLLHHHQDIPKIAPLERYSRLPEADVSAYAALGGVS